MVKQVNQEENLVHDLGEKQKTTGDMSVVFFTIILVVALALGIGGGYFLNGYFGKNSQQASSQTNTSQEAKKGVGILDKKEFPDSVEGVLRQGGVDGEGNFHLERPGGDSQNVYLTSSTVDLSQFIGKKVKVWGKTFQGQKAGWLMDVGYVENL